MSKQITSSQIFEQTMQQVAPLPCQESYARRLARFLSVHIHRNTLIDGGVSPDALPSPSAIIVAQTGQGKSFLVRKMVEALHLNMIHIDCGTLVAEGYKGLSLSQRLAAAMEEAPSKEAFEKSIVFFDEIDKLRAQNVDNSNAMTTILQMFNGGTVSIEYQKKPMSVNISRFGILCAGAFSGLESIVRERVCPKAGIGFSATDAKERLSDAELMQQATLPDLAKFGIMEELLGRIGSIFVIPPMDLIDYRQLLTAQHGSLQSRYHRYLHALYGVEFQITDAGADRIAARCMAASTGARAANPIVADMMSSAIAAVEDETSICRVLLDADADGCCIRYVHGERSASRFALGPGRRAVTIDEKRLPMHTVKAKDEASLVRTLLRYYKSAEGKPDILPELEAFLSCMIPFLHKECMPKEFNLSSLIKLSETVQFKANPEDQTPLDIIMEDRHYTYFPPYQQLSQRCDVWTSRNLVHALKAVQNRLWEHHGRCQVVFRIQKTCVV